MALDTKTARKVGDFLRKRLFGANKAPQGESTKLDGEIVLQQQAKAIRHAVKKETVFLYLQLCFVSLRWIAFFVTYMCACMHRELQSLLQRTIAQGEGNSLLVIGPKGSGKTWVGKFYTNMCVHLFA